ncbi:MAG: hypothetical protein AAGB34_05425 [Planctomycetota bacterium]
MIRRYERSLNRIIGWLLLGFVAQTLVAWAIGLNPQGWAVHIPHKLVYDDNRVGAMFADGRYSVTVVHALAPLRDEFRVRYSDLGSAESAEAFVTRWRIASNEIAKSNTIYAGERTFHDAPPGMQVYAEVEAVAGIDTDAVFPGGAREIGERDQLNVMATGWPLRSCRMTWIEREDETLEPFRGILLDPRVIPKAWRSGTSMYYPADETLGAIPARPMLLGTIGNSLVFGVFGFVAVSLLRLLRRRWRLSRGLCIGCGYNLSDGSAGVLAMCPECGCRSR